MTNPKWPSIKEQISAEKVARGSALEKMIRKNQEFDLLQPEETDDDAGLPLWLRVFWRKNHPDLEHPTVNPGGGYPDALYTLYDRMLAHPDLPWEKQSLTSKFTVRKKSTKQVVKKQRRKAGR